MFNLYYDRNETTQRECPNRLFSIHPVLTVVSDCLSGLPSMAVIIIETTAIVLHNTLQQEVWAATLVQSQLPESYVTLAKRCMHPLTPVTIDTVCPCRIVVASTLYPALYLRIGSTGKLSCWICARPSRPKGHRSCRSSLCRRRRWPVRDDSTRPRRRVVVCR